MLQQLSCNKHGKGGGSVLQQLSCNKHGKGGRSVLQQLSRNKHGKGGRSVLQQLSCNKHGRRAGGAPARLYLAGKWLCWRSGAPQARTAGCTFTGPPSTSHVIFHIMQYSMWHAICLSFRPTWRWHTSKWRMRLVGLRVHACDAMYVWRGLLTRSRTRACNRKHSPLSWGRVPCGVQKRNRPFGAWR